jgi:RNA polymerase sigma factor (sigma-70 family)
MMTPIGRPQETERSWAAVYEAHAPRLTRMATMLVGPADAHDLVADAVMSSVTSPGWSQVEEPGAYLTTALVRAAAAVHRSSRARSRREDRVARSMPRVSLQTASDDEIRRAVDQLSATQAAIVYLLYWDDLTIPMAAHQLGVSEGTVRRQLDRAKKRLRKVIDHGFR